MYAWIGKVDSLSNCQNDRTAKCHQMIYSAKRLRCEVEKIFFASYVVQGHISGSIHAHTKKSAYACNIHVSPFIKIQYGTDKVVA